MAGISPSLQIRFVDANGLPLIGGKLYSYAAGTSTPKATFTDSTETGVNPNPIILDASGGANYWLSPDKYKFVLKDANDVTLLTRDNVSNLYDQSVNTFNIVDGSVTAVKLADNSIATVKLQDSVVTAPKIASNAVTTAKILDANVTTDKIADANITTAKILDANVTLAKLAAGIFPGFTVVRPTAATGTIVVPARTYFMTFEGCNGGGGGGAGDSGWGGGGGGGGTYSRSTVAVTPGETLTYGIGAGGAGGPLLSIAGTAGGSTFVQRGSTTLFQGGGGAPGTSYSLGLNAVGGSKIVNQYGISTSGIDTKGGQGGGAGTGGVPGGKGFYSESGGGGSGGNGATAFGGSGGGGGGGAGVSFDGSTNTCNGGAGGNAANGASGAAGGVGTGYASGGGGGGGGNNGQANGVGGAGKDGWLRYSYVPGN